MAADYSLFTVAELDAEFKRQAAIYAAAADEREAILREMASRKLALKAKTNFDSLTEAEKAEFKMLFSRRHV